MGVAICMHTVASRIVLYLGEGPDPREMGNFRGYSPALKCIRLCKQQTPQQHGAADLSAGDGASRRKRGFGMDSPAAGVSSARAMRPLV